MEHSESIETMAAERYALGEMTPEERDRFEEHFFDCRECAPAVRDEVSIAVATHRLIPKPAAVPRTQWLPAAAAAAFVAILGYRYLVPSLHLRSDTPPAAHVVHVHPLLTAESREGGMLRFVATRDEEVQLYFDVPPETPYPSYVAEVRDLVDGKVRVSSPITAEEAREGVSLSIRPGVLDAGKYDLVVSGASPAKQNAVLDHYPFELSFR